MVSNNEQPKKRLNIVGIVHARGGSKRIPLKNIKPLNGKPLIAYLIEAAKKSKLLTRLIVSSDHPDIIRVSEEYGAEVPFVRPKDLAEDVPSELVTQHAVKFLEDKEGITVDIAVTLQPTAPFCQPEDIDGCIDMLINSDADCVFTGTTIRERPEWMFRMDKNSYITSFLNTDLKGEVGVSQNLPNLYMANGAAYATRRNVLFEKNSIFGDKMKIWLMSREASVDIDVPLDFEFAEFIARKIEQGISLSGTK